MFVARFVRLFGTCGLLICFEKQVVSKYQRKMLKGCGGELGRKGWLWKSKIRVKQVTNPANHKEISFPTRVKANFNLHVLVKIDKNVCVGLVQMHFF